SQDNNELALILQHGYLVVENCEVMWTRKAVDDEMIKREQRIDTSVRCKQSQVGGDEIFVVNTGVLVPSIDDSENHGGHRMNLFGSHAAIVNYQAFKQCVSFYAT